jgi:diacylglycerol O-acyltransferase
VVISNVPGPRRTKYLLGCEMLTHHPVGIAADSCALNITVQTYGPRMDLGLTACLETVPDIYALRDALAESWAALKAAHAAAAPLDEPEATPDSGRANEAA